MITKPEQVIERLYSAKKRFINAIVELDKDIAWLEKILSTQSSVVKQRRNKWQKQTTA